MATKKQVYHHYVLVMADGGPTFVTGEGAGNMSYWEKSEKPHEMDEKWAESMAFGLTVNGYIAFHVKSKIELDHQPYLYSRGHFEWKWNEENIKEEV